MQIPSNPWHLVKLVFYIFYSNLFSRSSNQESSSAGWKLFGKLPPKDDGKKPVKILPREEPYVRGMEEAELQ